MSSLAISLSKWLCEFQHCFAFRLINNGICFKFTPVCCLYMCFTPRSRICNTKNHITLERANNVDGFGIAGSTNSQRHAHNDSKYEMVKLVKNSKLQRSRQVAPTKWKLARFSLSCFLANFSMDFNSLRALRVNKFGFELVKQPNKYKCSSQCIQYSVPTLFQHAIGALSKNWYSNFTF